MMKRKSSHAVTNEELKALIREVIEEMLEDSGAAPKSEKEDDLKAEIRRYLIAVRSGEAAASLNVAIHGGDGKEAVDAGEDVDAAEEAEVAGEEASEDEVPGAENADSEESDDDDTIILNLK